MSSNSISIDGLSQSVKIVAGSGLVSGELRTNGINVKSLKLVEHEG